MCTDATTGSASHERRLGTFADPTSAASEVAAAEVVDPIPLDPVDELTVTTLVDNSFDALLADSGPARRTGFGALPQIAAPQYEGGGTVDGLVAEHGFAALVTVRSAGRSHTLLFDTGISPDGMAANAVRLGIDPGSIKAVVLSHGHFDHTGGLAGLARWRGHAGLPMVLHPLVWTRRRVAVPGNEPRVLPTLSRAAVEGEGFSVIERRQPSLVLDGCALVTGEVDRTTQFERGMPYHEGEHGGRFQPDPLILDDQALVVNVRGKGLVVLTGCGHAGAVNIALHAMRLTQVGKLHGLLGGFHLSGAAFEPLIEPTVAALGELAPQVIVPAHCTGWKAQHRLATAFGDAYCPNAVGTSFVFAAA